MCQVFLIVINVQFWFQSISPGFTKSEIMQAAGGTQEMAAAMDKLPALGAEDVSSAVLYALGAPQSVSVIFFFTSFSL